MFNNERTEESMKTILTKTYETNIPAQFDETEIENT